MFSMFQTIKINKISISIIFFVAQDANIQIFFQKYLNIRYSMSYISIIWIENKIYSLLFFFLFVFWSLRSSCRVTRIIWQHLGSKGKIENIIFLNSSSSLKCFIYEKCFRDLWDQIKCSRSSNWTGMKVAHFQVWRAIVQRGWGFHVVQTGRWHEGSVRTYIRTHLTHIQLTQLVTHI